MVKVGQTPTDRSLAEVSFRNPHDRLDVEVVNFAKLAPRLSGSLLSSVHRTAFHQLYVFSSGSATMTVDFVDYACHAGSVVHVRPGQVLRLPHSAASGVDAMAVLFTPSFPQPQPQLEAILGAAAPVNWKVTGPQQQRLLTAAAELQLAYAGALDETSQPEVAVAIALVRQQLGVLLLRLALLASVQPDLGRSREAVARFTAELERSYASTRTAEHYATRIGYSARTLNRACVAATGRTAKQLIDARVALEAKRLLVHTTMPAASIAQLLGFAEATNFQKFFVRQTGGTPGAFRALQITPPTTAA